MAEPKTYQGAFSGQQIDEALERVRDVETLMDAATYDPQNKAQDVFAYAAGLVDDAKPTYTTTTMLATGWSNGMYSFESSYPNSGYNLSIEVAPTATVEQFEAFCAAMICGSADSNVAKALGDVPSVDIPIIVKAVQK